MKETDLHHMDSYRQKQQTAHATLNALETQDAAERCLAGGDTPDPGLTLIAVYVS